MQDAPDTSGAGGGPACVYAEKKAISNRIQSVVCCIDRRDSRRGGGSTLWKSVFHPTPTPPPSPSVTIFFFNCVFFSQVPLHNIIIVVVVVYAVFVRPETTSISRARHTHTTLM